MISIATWNVNSVKSRLQHLLGWLAGEKPDIVLLQEIKCLNDAFPCMEIEELGYNLALHGEKTYNGVAILSKFPLEDIRRGLPGDDQDIQARYIEAVVSLPSSPRKRGELEGGDHSQGSHKLHDTPTLPSPASGGGKILRIASIYVPNGQDPASDKFQYKLRFLNRLAPHVKELLSYEEMLVIGGDYNVAPEDIDVHDPNAWEGSVLTHDDARGALRKTINLGLYNAMRLVHPASPSLPSPSKGEGIYSWWDYRANAFAADDGLLIDHLLLSPQAADQLQSCTVEKKLRAMEKASDHAPVMAMLSATPDDR